MNLRDILVSPVMIPLEEQTQIDALDTRGDHVVGGFICDGELRLMTGDNTIATVPLSFFTPSGTGTTPDFEKFAIIDYGRTLQFGPYEAAVDVVLDESRKW
jgi:hypothetical protein